MLVWSITPARCAEAVYTRIDEATCRSTTGDGYTEKRCKGPVGFVAIITSRDQVVQIEYRSAAAAELRGQRLGSDLRWRSPSGAIGKQIEWRMIAGRPIAAIARIFSMADSGTPEQQLLVARVTPGGSCELSRLKADDTNAYGTARDLADSQASSGCEP